MKLEKLYTLHLKSPHSDANDILNQGRSIVATKMDLDSR